MRLGACKTGLSPRFKSFCFVSWCLNFFVLLAPYVCFHSFSQVKVTEWPPIGKIAAHSAYDMFNGIST